ncbi:hypothetical protein [Endozoicomonas acroporae]|uniref:hypothetical protein n=1 Tax=Endozoicomonas acroporae TaxID=1701104 RepID=UPI0013D66ECE|nr:hypothetical protein [Endozoicomonas acroporae]
MSNRFTHIIQIQRTDRTVKYPIVNHIDKIGITNPGMTTDDIGLCLQTQGFDPAINRRGIGNGITVILMNLPCPNTSICLSAVRCDITVHCQGVGSVCTLFKLSYADSCIGPITGSCNIAIHRCAPGNGATIIGNCSSDACTSQTFFGFDRAAQRCGAFNEAATFNRSRSNSGICTLAHCFNVAVNRCRVGNSSIFNNA